MPLSRRNCRSSVSRSVSPLRHELISAVSCLQKAHVLGSAGTHRTLGSNDTDVDRPDSHSSRSDSLVTLAPEPGEFDLSGASKCLSISQGHGPAQQRS